MGLFGGKNKGDFCPKEGELKFLVTNYTGHNGIFNINAKLNVPAGYEFIIGKKGKVTDKFTEGEHFITFANLPYTCRRFKIDKIEDGKQKDKFTAEGYFVDKSLRAGKFKTYRKVEMGTKAYGIFRAHVYGMYSYKVSNAQELMQSLLNEFDYIKTGEAEDLIENWVDDLVVSVLEKNNFILPDVVANSPMIAEKLKQAVGKMFTIAGLEIVDLKIYKYKLPKEYQAESDKNIANQQAGDGSADNEKEASENGQETALEIENAKEEQSVEQEASLQEQTLEAKDENAQEPNVNLSSSETSETLTNNQEQSDMAEYVPFGNFVIKDEKADKISSSNQKEKTFVDLSLDKLYDNTMQKTKRCVRCGGENDLHADHCILCGEKFDDE